MTESDWFTCTDPLAMLTFLRDRGASDRKLRLFTVACCRRAMPYMDHDGSRALVELVERHLEGHIPSVELENARQVHERWCSATTPEWDYLNRADRAALDAADLCMGSVALDNTALWIEELVHLIPQSAAAGAVEVLLAPVYAERTESCDAIPSPHRQGEPPPSLDEVMAYFHQHEASWELVEQARAEGLTREQGEQANLLRDIFGNPFHPIAFSPEWRTDTVVALARGIYEERAFDGLPLLMDALMDAGYTEEVVLEHCRVTTGHHHGCWVVDLVLGKE